MATYLFLAALITLAVGFVPLLAGTVARPQRMPLRLFGMYAVGTSFFVMSAAFLASGLLLGNVLFAVLSAVYGVDTYLKANRERYAYRQNQK